MDKLRVVLSTNRVVPYTAALHAVLGRRVDLRIVTADLGASTVVGYRQVLREMPRSVLPGVIIAGDFGRRAAYGAFLAARRLGVPFVFWTDEFDPQPPWRDRWLPMASRRFMARRADAFLVCGARQARWAAALGARPGRIFTFHYPVLDWPQDAAPRETGSATRLLFLGRMVVDKGPDLLVRALALMTELRWSATMAGGGPAAGWVRQLIATHHLEDRIVFQEGWVTPDHRQRLFQSHDALVLPSRQEPWGIVATEAQAWGLPAIVSIHAGAVEGGLVDGRTGLVVSPLTVERLTEVLADVVQHPERVQAMSKEARLWARRFTVGRQADVVMDAIRHVAGLAQR